ncbi:MAG TPA: hypothetical protein VFL14_07330 [Xanthomonadales bacterium]|nr:hypothetical protein [Xanthomonadales bacterium]
MTHPLRLLVPLFVLALAACGRKEEGAPAPEEAAADEPVATEVAPTSPPAVDAQPANPDAPLTADDLDRYATGMAREIELLQGHSEALAKARAAKDESGEIAAMMALQSVEVRDLGAQAAGVDAARWVAIKEKIGEVLAAQAMAGPMLQQVEEAEKAELSGLGEDQRKQHAEGIAQMRAAFGNPYDRLPPELVDAFKAREAELAKLRNDALELQLGALKG